MHAGDAVLASDDLQKLLEGEFRSRASIPSTYRSLTDTEREVPALVARGSSNIEIAQQLFVSESTVKTHVGIILRKLDLPDRVQIVVFAHDPGLPDRR